MNRREKFYLTLVMAGLLLIFANAWLDGQPKISYHSEAGQ